MDTQYHALKTVALPQATDLIHVDARPQRPLNLHSPAIEVMTDLRVIDPVNINEDAKLNDAHTRMVSHGIRLLFVTNDKEQLVGLLTASDVQGERPLKCVHEHHKRRSEILVADIMTPRRDLDALDMHEVLHSNVGHIIATLRSLGRQHALAVEKNTATGHYEICGLFSTSTISRRLGISLNFVRVPQAFAEIEHALLHHN